MSRQAPFVRTLGGLVFRLRDYLAPVILALLLVSARRGDFVADPVLDLCLGALGLAFLVLGTAIRLTVAAQVDIRRSGIRRRVAASRLVRTGLYAHVRNPLYLGNLLLLTGLALIYDSRPAYLVIVPGALVAFTLMVATEEAFLAAKFGGEFDEYRARVRRIVPRLDGLWTMMRTAAFDWRRALRREHGTMFATASSAIVLIAAKRVVLDGLGASGATLRGAALVWLACLAPYLLLRWLKKTERLLSPAELAMRRQRDTAPLAADVPAKMAS